jgi:hypothetical protein
MRTIFRLPLRLEPALDSWKVGREAESRKSDTMLVDTEKAESFIARSHWAACCREESFMPEKTVRSFLWILEGVFHNSSKPTFFWYVFWCVV